MKHSIFRICLLQKYVNVYSILTLQTVTAGAWPFSHKKMNRHLWAKCQGIFTSLNKNGRLQI